MNYWTESNRNIYVAAHRGWPARYPENTMESFRAAAELGVDQIETDVRITADGELVCIHDATVDRTTDGSGRVDLLTLAELKALDAGIRKGEEFRGCRIPTFIEFMDYVSSGSFPSLTLDVELKEYPTPGHEEIAWSVCDRVLKIIDDYGFTDRVVINTFAGDLHEYIADKYGAKYRRHVYYPIRHLSDRITRDPYADGAFCCCMFSSVSGEIMATKEEFAAMAARGIEPWAGAGVKNEAGVRQAAENGATLITCNNPDEILAILRRMGLHS